MEAAVEAAVEAAAEAEVEAAAALHLPAEVAVGYWCSCVLLLRSLVPTKVPLRTL